VTGNICKPGRHGGPFQTSTSRKPTRVSAITPPMNKSSLQAPAIAAAHAEWTRELKHIDLTSARRERNALCNWLEEGVLFAAPTRARGRLARSRAKRRARA
jgi:hypothetical protein